MTTGDLRERLAVLETLARQSLEGQQENARERKHQVERLEADRKEDAREVKAALTSAAIKSDRALEVLGTRIGAVESDIEHIKIGWILLVKAGSIGGAIMTTLVGVAVWIGIKVGWIAR